MKKFFYLLFLFTAVTQAQISLQYVEGGVDVNDGDIVTVTDENQVAKHFIVTNNYAYDINISLEVVDIINTDGSELQICFGVGGNGGCHFPVAEGNIFQGGAPLSAGASTGQNDIDFMQIENGNFPTYPKDYVIKISALNTSDNSEISSITFTFRYDSTSYIDKKLNKDDFQLSVSYGAININSKYAAKVSIYNLTGQKIKELNVNKGKTVINADFTKGIYIIHAVADNRELYQRIIIN